MENKGWNKKIFAMLIDRAKGDRSLRQFAIECDISYVQMRKLVMMVQENPPRPKLIRKIADHAFNEVDFADLMYAAGLLNACGRLKENDDMLKEGFVEKYRRLSPTGRKSAADYIDFLLTKY